MLGVHWRFDSQEGLLLGEMVAVRILQQVTTRTEYLGACDSKACERIRFLDSHQQPPIEICGPFFSTVDTRTSMVQLGHAPYCDDDVGPRSGWIINI